MTTLVDAKNTTLKDKILAEEAALKEKLAEAESSDEEDEKPKVEGKKTKKKK